MQHHNIILTHHTCFEKAPFHSIRSNMDTAKASWSTVCFFWHS